MPCKLCAWLCDWLCSDSGLDQESFRQRSKWWERHHSNEWEQWCEETESNRELIDRACALDEKDPDAAFRLYLKAAEAGSVWATQQVAWYYDAVESDFEKAREYYRRAVRAGSWMATIRYAHLLARHGCYGKCERLLEIGVKADFVPAYFWLAWYRYKQSKTRDTCNEIRPLLEHAAEEGHPEAKLILARFLLRGKYGIRQIPRGLGLARELVSEASAEGPTQSAPVDQSSSLSGPTPRHT